MKKLILGIMSLIALGSVLFIVASPHAAVGPVSTVSKLTIRPFLFADIATFFSANGQIGYCSDCTIANPCAGGGTGAIAKRLNSVNVCN